MSTIFKASDFLASLQLLTKEDLLDIHGIGEVLADNYLEFTRSDRYARLIQGFENLEKKGTTVTISAAIRQNTQELPLSGQIIVITGSFDISRDRIKEELEERGAKVSSSISAHTTILIAGEKAGSKLTKAQQIGVTVITDYRDLIQ